MYTMFRDEVLETVTVVSDLREQKYVRDQLCETKPIKYKETFSQALERNNVETQTDFEVELPHKTRLKIDISQSLSNFLLLIYPTISEQLIANTRSHAFDGYEVDWEDKVVNSTTTCLHTLRNNQIVNQNVTSVCWNSTGSVIAAALGSFEHNTWCVHQSFVCLWNIDRQNIDVNKADKVIDSDTCLMSIDFHSKQPSLLAGGDFSGKVYIWDMSQEDNALVAFSGKETISHQEPISKVMWTTSLSVRIHRLVSVGVDGCILEWEFNQLKKELKIVKKILVQSENIPRRMRQGITRGDIKLGISCLSFSNFNQDDLFVGSENGIVLKCSLSAKYVSSSEPDFMSTPMQYFESHIGPVTCIDSSPLLENIFLTSGSDMTVHIYSTMQEVPVITLEPGMGTISSSKWSHSRPTVLFVAAKDILIFDLSIDSLSYVSLVNVCSEERFFTVNSLACNPYQHNILATGDSNGVIQVWRIPTEYIISKQGEENFFKTTSISEW